MLLLKHTVTQNETVISEKLYPFASVSSMSRTFPDLFNYQNMIKRVRKSKTNAIVNPSKTMQLVYTISQTNLNNCIDSYNIYITSIIE